MNVPLSLETAGPSVSNSATSPVLAPVGEPTTSITIVAPESAPSANPITEVSASPELPGSAAAPASGTVPGSAAAPVKPAYPPPAEVPTQQGPFGIQFDFNNGCRVSVPQSQQQWRVRLNYLDTGKLLFPT